MQLKAPFVQLPLRFDAARLAAEVDALGEAVWRPHPQKFPGNSMLPLVAVEGDAGNESFNGPMRPTPELESCLYLQQVLASFGATVGRTRLMRLSGGAEVKRHADQGYYWAERVRVHVPIVTQPTVRFECDREALNMAEGECWIFDTWRQHRVLNDDSRSRIHLVCDTVGGDGFWNLVEAGRPVGAGAAPAGWAPREVAFEAATQPRVRFESHNVPAVMSPWELRRHLEFLLDEAVPFPRQAALRQQVDVLCRSWRGLWAAEGPDERAKPEYRRLLERFVQNSRPLAADASLCNELPLFPAIMMMVGRAAVVDDAAPRGQGNSFARQPVQAPRPTSAQPVAQSAPAFSFTWGGPSR